MAITMTVMMTRMIIGKVNGINTKEQIIYSLFYIMSTLILPLKIEIQVC